MADKIALAYITIRLSISFLVIKLVLIDLLTSCGVVAIYLFFWDSVISTYLLKEYSFYSLILFLFFVTSKIVLTVFLVLLWVNEYYEITSTDIIYKRGWFFTKTEKHPLNHFRSVSIHQSMLGRLLNYGTISLYDSWEKKYVYMYLIHNPDRYIHILEKLVPNADEEKDVTRKNIFEEGDNQEEGE